MASASNVYEDLEIHIEEEVPESAPLAGGPGVSEHAPQGVDVEIDPNVKKKLPIKKILLGTITISVLAAVVFLETDDITRMLGVIPLPALNSGDVKSDLWNTKLNEVITQSKTQYSDLGGQLNQVESTVKSFTSYKEHSIQAAQLAKQNQQAIALLASSLKDMEMNINLLLDAADSSVKSPVQSGDFAPDIAQLKHNLAQVIVQTSELSKLAKDNQRGVNSIRIQYAKMEDTRSQNESNVARLKEASKKPNAISVKVPWELKAADYNKKVAMLYNPYTKVKITVSLQSIIPKCGRVTDIVERENAVLTTDCIIKRG